MKIDWINRWFFIVGVMLFVLVFGAFYLMGSEREEVNRLATKYEAKSEVRLWDATRVDLLSAVYAIEVDYAPKWAEAIGQSLYYSILSKRKAGIVLLIKDMKRESRYVYRCQTVCTKYGITLWIEKVKDVE